ncbi:amidohydrolase family protein [Niallia sp. NCCP-28]|uniref:amidohydrolase family protein n=1 Tax=Niallia sp. NCCP-28 TaxID=2934712 RepID=UPI002088FF57|nr:amidohydrolase family protein [Niallia sp. NCCP-28]GKU85081.1 N-acyl-D-amino-acid deacylase [Niallia sp. NCCP-28]
MDLVISNARIPNYDSLMNVAIDKGKIVSVMPACCIDNLAAKEIIDAKKSLLLPGLIEPHIHLEKAYMLSLMKEDACSLWDAIRITAELKSQFTKEDIKERSIKVLKNAVLNGVSHLRCHVEVDPILQLKAMEVMLELKESFCHLIDLQIVVFPQEGIFTQPGTAELMEEALRMGGDIVGGIPYNDRDMEEHINYVFHLAEKYRKPVDFHADFSDNPQDLSILKIAEQTIRRGLQGQVAAGHVTSLGSVLYEHAVEVAKQIAKADLSIITLPATDLYLNGRGDQEKIRRGIAPVQLLLEHGSNVIFGTNNIQNAFTPFGKGDPLDIAWLLAQTAYFGSKQDADMLVEMTTTRAAKALNIQNYGIQEGAQADLVLMEAASVRDCLINRPERKYVWKRGVKVATTNMQQELFNMVKC